ncbi:MAG: hypothetical protein L0Z50_06840 [Verrucomicrobiales bacterium]|nr:hypothetical protein [Verrucomicrobiales bacterium]
MKTQDQSNHTSLIARLLVALTSLTLANSTPAADIEFYVYRTEQTVPVTGRRDVRAVLNPTAGKYQPVEFDQQRRGWRIVAESFPEYQSVLSSRSPELPPSVSPMSVVPTAASVLRRPRLPPQSRASALSFRERYSRSVKAAGTATRLTACPPQHNPALNAPLPHASVPVAPRLSAEPAHPLPTPEPASPTARR